MTRRGSIAVTWYYLPEDQPIASTGLGYDGKKLVCAWTYDNNKIRAATETEGKIFNTRKEAEIWCESRLSCPALANSA